MVNDHPARLTARRSHLHTNIFSYSPATRTITGDPFMQ